MMDQWRPFDIKSFIKASKHWDDDIKILQQKHDDLSLLPSSSDVPAAKNGTVADLTASIALRRLEIASQIEQILLYKSMLAYAMKTLSDKDKRLIEGFYYPTKPISVFIDQYGMEYGMGRTAIYQEREKIEKRMARIIEAEYY